jgi:hypothetical protein
MKYYGNASEGGQKRYSPAEFSGSEKIRVIGDPDPKYISTLRRTAKPLGPHDKSQVHALDKRLLEEDREPHGLRCARLLRIQLIKIHRTLRVSPAMAAGVTGKLWEVRDLVAAWEASSREEESGVRLL